MDVKGLVRRVDDMGRITLPKEARREYGILPGDPVEIICTTEGILVKPHEVQISSRVRAIAVELEALVNDPEDYKLVNQLIKISDELKLIDK